MLPGSTTSNPMFLSQRAQKQMWKTCRDQMLALFFVLSMFIFELSFLTEIWSSLIGESSWPGMCYLCIQGWDWMCCLPLGHAFLCSYWGSKLRPSYSHKHFTHWDITSAPWNFNILISTYKGIPIANLSLMSVPSLQTAHLPSHMIGSCGVGVGVLRTSSAPSTHHGARPLSPARPASLRRSCQWPCECRYCAAGATPACSAHENPFLPI